jgi:hypothetical protein
LDALLPDLRLALNYLTPDPKRWYNVGNLQKRLNAGLKSYAIRIVVEDDSNVNVNDPVHFCLMGGWCFENRIDIHIGVDPTTRRIWFDDNRLRQFTNRMLRSVTHELVHRFQMEHRADGWDHTMVYASDSNVSRIKQKDQEYFGNYNEIEAYAHDIVQEFWHRWPGASNLSPYRLHSLVKRQFIANDENLGYHSRSLWFYHNAFHGDINHPAIVTLLRKVHSWAGNAMPIDHLWQPSR